MTTPPGSMRNGVAYASREDGDLEPFPTAPRAAPCPRCGSAAGLHLKAEPMTGVRIATCAACRHAWQVVG
jgi:formate dehydrogenase maturation protein FdhE